MDTVPERDLRKRSRKKHVIVFGVGGLVVAAAVAALAVDLIDDHTRREVRARVEAEYFAGVRKYVVDTATEKLQGRCDVADGIAAADEFLNKERDHMALQVVHQPKWGWQVQRYRFAISWRSKRIATFRLDKAYKPVVLEQGSAFGQEVEKEVCKAACSWPKNLKCLFVNGL